MIILMGNSSELLVVLVATVVISLVCSTNSETDHGERLNSSVTISSQASNEIDTEHDFRRIACGSTATNLSHIAVKNPQYPEAIYSKAICEAIIERVDPSVHELNIKFKQLELYRPTYDGQCLHDRFAIYTDLNAIVGPVLCGNQTDLDHDRTWHIEIEQRR